MIWRRTPAAEPAIAREEVIAILGGLADVYATTLDIRRILLEEDDEEEEADS